MCNVAMGWTGKSQIYRPSGIKPVYQSALGDAKFSGPLTNCLCSAIESDRLTAAAIVILLGACRPSAIVRCVVAIGVDAINGMMRTWSAAHIGKEVLKTVLPSVANSNTAAAIIGVPDVRWGIASGFHGNPRAIFGGPGTTVGCDNLTVQTATTRGSALREIAGRNETFCPAFTSAYPTDAAPEMGTLGNDCPTSELLSTQIKESHRLPFCAAPLCCMAL
jgi:hypothetical protein